jgi:hypothetical protein
VFKQKKASEGGGYIGAPTGLGRDLVGTEFLNPLLSVAPFFSSSSAPLFATIAVTSLPGFLGSFPFHLFGSIVFLPLFSLFPSPLERAGPIGRRALLN